MLPTKATVVVLAENAFLDPLLSACKEHPETEEWKILPFSNPDDLFGLSSPPVCDIALLSTDFTDPTPLQMCQRWVQFAPTISFVCCTGNMPPSEQWISYYQWGARDLIRKTDVKPEILARWVRFCYSGSRLSPQAEQDQGLLEVLMRYIPDWIYFKDRESRFIRISHGHAKVFGLEDPRDAIGRTDFDYLKAEFAQAALEDEQSILSTGQPIIGQTEFRETAHGTTYWVDTTKLPLVDTYGQIIGTFGISRDITEKVEAQEALKNLNDRLVHSEQRLQETLSDLRTAHLHLVEAEKARYRGKACQRGGSRSQKPAQHYPYGTGVLAEERNCTRSQRTLSGHD